VGRAWFGLVRNGIWALGVFRMALASLYEYRFRKHDTSSDRTLSRAFVVMGFGGFSGKEGVLCV